MPTGEEKKGKEEVKIQQPKATGKEADKEESGAKGAVEQYRRPDERLGERGYVTGS